MTNRKPDWSAWNNWCDARIDARRDFDREVLIEVISELTGMIEDQTEKLNAQAERARSLDIRVAELIDANDLRAADERRMSVQLADHQMAIAELRQLLRLEQAKAIELPNLMQRRGLN